jgi:cell division protein FtsA
MAYICTLDIGSSKIACALAELGRDGYIKNIFFEFGPSKGIKQARIFDSQQLSDSIADVLDKLRKKAGINVRSLWLGVAAVYMLAKHSRAIIPLAQKGSRLVTPFDVQKVIEQARILGASLEEEIIAQVPHRFCVDEQKDVLNPVGFYGHRLEVDLYLVCVKTNFVLTIRRIVNRLGYEIADMFFSSLSTTRIAFKQEHLVSCGRHIFCDIGADITQMLIFHNAILQDFQILPFGGNDLTTEIAAACNIPFALAEDIKKSRCWVGDMAQPDKEIIIKKRDGRYISLSQRRISGLLSRKVEFLCALIKEGLTRSLNTASIEPSINQMVVAGRSALLSGFLEMLEARLGFPVKMIGFSDVTIFKKIKGNFLISTPHLLTYISCLGLIQEAVNSFNSRLPFSLCQPRNLLSKILYKIKYMYQEYF